MSTIPHNFTAKELYTLLHDGLVSMVGISIGIFLSGIVVTLGISSIFFLSSKREALSRQDTLLCIYITVLLLLLVAFETQSFANYNDFTVFSSLNGAEYELRSIRAWSMILVVLVGLTDGLLVWRCFMVQRVLGHGSSKWANMFWVIPACLWGTTIVSTITASILVAWDGVFGILGLITNVALNLFATSYITTRLLLLRRMVTRCLGSKKLTTQHLYLVGIFLESAAFNVPITIVTAVGVGTGRFFGTVFALIIPASQALACVLIIHQVALGRAFGQRREGEVQGMVTTIENNNNGNSE